MWAELPTATFLSTRASAMRKSACSAVSNPSCSSPATEKTDPDRDRMDAERIGRGPVDPDPDPVSWGYCEVRGADSSSSSGETSMDSIARRDWSSQLVHLHDEKKY